MDEHFDEVEGEVPPEEVEAYDVDEIQKDGRRVDEDINEIDDALDTFFIYGERRETIVDDDGQVDGDDHGQVEAHPLEIKPYGLAEAQLVEKMEVEQIEHPTANADGQQDSRQTVD